MMCWLLHEQHFQCIFSQKNEFMFHTFACFSVVEVTINMAALGRSDRVNMICEIQILAARSLPSVLIAFLREKHFSQESSNECFADGGHREAFVGKSSRAQTAPSQRFRTAAGP